VPQLIVPDNPRSLVSDACRYEPKLNETVRDFARYYAVSTYFPHVGGRICAQFPD
jgi:hypothetical protein